MLMRILAIIDKTIPDEELREVFNQFSDIYAKVGVNVDIDQVREDLSDLPYEYYDRDSRGISKKYLSERIKEIQVSAGKRYDHITFMVDHKNWVPFEDNVWGWNLGAGMYGYEVQQCRFETRPGRSTRNIIANSLGTLYHETMHAHDQFVERMLGKRIEKIVGVNDWDDAVVHGKHPDYDYIRHKHNEHALEKIAPLLKEAFAKRERQYKLKITILERLVEAYTKLLQTMRNEDQQ